LKVGCSIKRAELSKVTRSRYLDRIAAFDRGNGARRHRLDDSKAATVSKKPATVLTEA
jgi:hypothetical protein